MPDGFGGTLAAPIWHDYMQAADDGFCGDFPQPTDPWHGQPFHRPPQRHARGPAPFDELGL